MTEPVAKRGDRITGTDTHLVIPEGGGSPVATPLPFDGVLDAALSPNVLAEGEPIALLGSEAHQLPGHIVAPKSFQTPPSNRARVIIGSPTVLANHRAIVRNGDTAETCNDPTDLPVGQVVAGGTVLAR